MYVLIRNSLPVETAETAAELAEHITAAVADGASVEDLAVVEGRLQPVRTETTVTWGKKRGRKPGRKARANGTTQEAATAATL